jgi:hypothetical protein
LPLGYGRLGLEHNPATSRMGQAAGFSRLPADDLRRQDSMAGALAKAAHIRRIWRGRDLKIATSGVAKAQPKADLRCSEPGNVPGRQLTAHELIQMAQAARWSQPGPDGVV